MSNSGFVRLAFVALAVGLALLLVIPQLASAQLPLPLPGTTSSSTVTGWATALQATVLGTTTALASTGTLANDADALDASALAGQIPSVGGAEVLSAATISSIDGWNTGDSVSSEASLATLALTVAGIQISADFVMSRAIAVVGGTNAGLSDIEGLTVNGVSIAPDGTQNQTLSVPGLTIVLNEVQPSAGTITVNALHITSWDGLVNLVVTSATAGISQ